MVYQIELADADEVGDLGVLHLKRLWSKSRLGLRGRLPDALKDKEWTRDMMVIDGLALPLEHTMRVLHQDASTFDAFEDWILKSNGGHIDQWRIDRINANVRNEPYSHEVNNFLSDIDNHAPVLSEEDLAFFHENGYVKAKGAVPKETCRAAAKAIWDFMGMDAHDPESWYQGQASIMVPLFDHPAMWAARKSPGIHKAFSQAWGTSDLWMSVDKAALNPPERHDWHFPGPSLHWDTSLIPPVKFGMQGILCLTDTTADQGAFTTVPGFHKKIDRWLKELPPDANPREQDLLSLGAKSIPGEVGDLIIWQNAMPHGASPNRAQSPRIVMFIDMYPEQREFYASWK